MVIDPLITESEITLHLWHIPKDMTENQVHAHAMRFSYDLPMPAKPLYTCQGSSPWPVDTWICRARPNHALSYTQLPRFFCELNRFILNCAHFSQTLIA
jgi:hypothetical protein